MAALRLGAEEQLCHLKIVSRLLLLMVLLLTMLLMLLLSPLLDNLFLSLNMQLHTTVHFAPAVFAATAVHQQYSGK